MKQLTKYSELKGVLSSYSWRIGERIQCIETLIKPDSVNMAYGKNIFSKIRDQKIYLITNYKMIIITWEPFVISSYNIGDIFNIQYELISNNNNRLEINFNNGYVVELNNINDGNPDWESEYFEYIMDIYRYFMEL